MTRQEKKDKESCTAVFCSTSRELVNLMKESNRKLDILINMNKGSLEINQRSHEKQESLSQELKPVIIPDALSLISVPKVLRKTIIALYKVEKATAEDLSHETKRLRAIESQKANQLVRLGYVEKRREGHKVYFYINECEANE